MVQRSPSNRQREEAWSSNQGLLFSRKRSGHLRGVRVGCKLFRAEVPLSGMEGLPLPSWLTHLHVVVVIQEEEGEGEGEQRMVCFDFLPVDPTSPEFVAKTHSTVMNLVQDFQKEED